MRRRAALSSTAMNYGFLIDNRKCIGCHACSTACKSENEVPLGVNRTWVKYTEKGVFPDTKRFFQVTRCNHCADPPCVHICPVTAMYQRPDGIVEFDPEACIGCKACIQACPYDAVYIDPESHTAAKCHFCAHRVDVGLEPACVVVCPEHAILAGDIDDPMSEIARTLATQQVRVRKPEQGTKPKLFYIDAEETSIVPMAAAQDGGMLWSQWPDHEHDDWRGPIHVEDGKMAGALLRSSAAAKEVYNAPHRIPWHWQVPAYLVAKAIGAGAFLVAVLGTTLGLLPATPLFTTVALFIALLFIGINTGLLVWDLDRPERFLSVLLRPQWRSWLAKGAYVLVGFSLLATVMFGAYLLGMDGVATSPLLIWPAVALAVMAAIYTAFLFAQAEGRDLWQSTLLPWHLLVQAVQSGAAILLIAALLFEIDAASLDVLRWTLGTSTLLNLFITAGGEFAIPHASQVAAAAARMITKGKYRKDYLTGIIAGMVIPLAIVVFAGASPVALALGGVAAIYGLFAYEWAFVMAPQEIPNS
jgi:Fe-S-cluster-containing dehydrogenase component/formate-dependent nitrite reductase membrane component NrfD